MKLVEWLAKSVTDDPRALRWFAEEGSDDRIARAFRELLAGYEIEPGTLLKTTRMLEEGERPGLVEVSDIRPAVKEQVESLGAKFIEVPAQQDAEDKGGYAKEASAEFKRAQEEALRRRVAEADAVICTALIPGRPAPKRDETPFQ